MGIRTTPVKVALLAMDSRSSKSLEMVFANRSEGKVELAAQQQAQLVIVDMDSQDALSVYRNFKQTNPQIPVVALAQGALPAECECTVVSKPISVSVLLDAIAGAGVMSSPEDTTQSKVTSDKVQRALAALDAMKTAEGLGKKIEKKTELPAKRSLSKLSDEMYFDPERFLLGKVISSHAKAREHKSGAVLQCWKDKIVIIDGVNDEIRSNLNSNQIRSMAIAPLDDELASPVNVREMDCSNAEFKKLLSDKSLNCASAEVFLWNLGLLTSRGRIPRGADIEQRVYLRRWPNLTRVMPADHVMRILAYWVRQASSAVEISTALKIELEDVFAIYSAANACGLAGIARRRVDELMAMEELFVNERRGLFASILGHLRPQRNTVEKYA